MLSKGLSFLSALAVCNLISNAVAAPHQANYPVKRASGVSSLAVSTAPSKPKESHETVTPVVTVSSVASTPKVTHAPKVELEPFPASAMSGQPNRTAQVSLKTSESWYWGLAGNPHAELTMRATGDRNRFLSMEAFSSSLKSVHCDADSVSFAFNNMEMYNTAKASYEWLNQGNRTVFLVTEQPGCGESARQPFHATGARFNDNEATATFDTEQTTWQDGVTHGTLRYNSAGIGSKLSHQNGSTHSLVRRVSASVKPDLTHNFNGQIFDQSFDGVNAELDCTNCTTTGTLDFEATVDLIPPGLSSTFSTSNVGVTIGLDLSLEAALNSPISDTFAIASVPLPGGVTVIGVDIGPQLDVNFVTGITQLDASADLQFGVEASLPDTTVALGSSNDFPSPSFTALGPTVSGSVNVTGNITPQIILSIGATVAGKGFSAGMAVAAPDITLDVAAQVGGSNGFCGDTSAEAGVEFDANIGFGIDLFAGLGAATKLPNSVNIFTTSDQVFSTCVTVAGSSSTAAAATTTSAAPAPTITFTSFSDSCCDQGCNTGGGLETDSQLSIVADGNTCGQINGGGQGGLNSAQFVDLNQCVISFFTDSQCTNVGPGLSITSPLNGDQCISNSTLQVQDNNVNFIKMSCAGS